MRDFRRSGRKSHTTFTQCLLQALLVGVEADFEEGESHGEDHPDVNHLDIGGRR